MNELQFGNKIRQILDQGTHLDATTQERLRAAREQALARQHRAPVAATQWADNVLGQLGGWSGISLRVIVPVVALGIGLFAIYGWQQNHRVAEVEEIDAQLLTDDLPIDAYLDRGFQNWLKSRAADSEEPADESE